LPSQSQANVSDPVNLLIVDGARPTRFLDISREKHPRAWSNPLQLPSCSMGFELSSLPRPCDHRLQERALFDLTPSAAHPRRPDGSPCPEAVVGVPDGQPPGSCFSWAMGHLADPAQTSPPHRLFTSARTVLPSAQSSSSLDSVPHLQPEPANRALGSGSSTARLSFTRPGSPAIADASATVFHVVIIQEDGHVVESRFAVILKKVEI
jgi:hypothetical protein